MTDANRSAKAVTPGMFCQKCWTRPCKCLCHPKAEFSDYLPPDRGGRPDLIPEIASHE